MLSQHKIVNAFNKITRENERSHIKLAIAAGNDYVYDCACLLNDKAQQFQAIRHTQHAATDTTNSVTGNEEGVMVAMVVTVMVDADNDTGSTLDMSIPNIFFVTNTFSCGKTRQKP